MPFKSKAQQRFMFSQHPRMAKRWADETKDIKDLPEKLHPDRTVPMKKQAGMFFRDLPGREGGNFYKAAMAQMGGPFGETPRAGSLFGTGEGSEKKEEPPKEKKDEKPAAKEEEEKEAAAAPSDWDVGAASSLPTGYHRPSREQPEALEAGGERFHSTTEKGRGFSGVDGPVHGITEGGRLKSRATQSPQMGKHASADLRYMGTSINKSAANYQDVKDYVGARVSDAGVGGQKLLAKGEEYAAAGKEGAKKLLHKADKGLKEGLRTPGGAAAAAGIGGLIAAGLLRKGGRGAMRLFRGKQKPPPGLIDRATTGIRNYLGK